MKTGRERHAELDRLLKQAIQCLESLDLRGAKEALEQASVEAAFPQDDAGSTERASPSADSDVPVSHPETRGTQPRLDDRG